MWEDLIQKAKEGGLDVIETYVFWNVHEPSPGNVLFTSTFLLHCSVTTVYLPSFLSKFRCLTLFLCGFQYNFEGRYDLVRFIKLIQKAGLYAHLRIGPYVCAEWNFGYLQCFSPALTLFLSRSPSLFGCHMFPYLGYFLQVLLLEHFGFVMCRGFPVWLKYVPGISFRTDNEPFKVVIFSRTQIHGFWHFSITTLNHMFVPLQRAMQGFTEKIVGLMKRENLFESQGGPIILSQVGPLRLLAFLYGFI